MLEAINCEKNCLSFVSYSPIIYDLPLSCLQLLEAGEGLNDYQWHTLTMLRTVRDVKVIVNGDRVIDTELPATASQDDIMDYVINVDELKLGQPIGSKSNYLFSHKANHRESKLPETTKYECFVVVLILL